MKKPSPIHYFVANEWPSKIWLVAFPTGFVVWVVHLCWPLLLQPTTWTDPLLFVGCCLLAALLGYFVSIPFGWPILGPMYYSRSLRNGEPFQHGDMVQILTGPFRDRVVRVLNSFDIAEWAGAHRIRVDLGTETKDDENVFRSIQIMRVAKAEETGSPTTESTPTK